MCPFKYMNIKYSILNFKIKYNIYGLRNNDHCHSKSHFRISFAFTCNIKKKTVDLSVKVNLIVYYYVLVRFQLRVYILQLNVFFFQLNSYSE